MFDERTFDHRYTAPPPMDPGRLREALAVAEALGPDAPIPKRRRRCGLCVRLAAAFRTAPTVTRRNANSSQCPLARMRGRT